MTHRTRAVAGLCALFVLVCSACGVDPESDERPFDVAASSRSVESPAAAV